LNEGGFVELDVRGAAVDTFDVERWKGDQVVLIPFVDMQNCMSDLLRERLTMVA
jgi:hypothetical protein